MSDGLLHPQVPVGIIVFVMMRAVRYGEPGSERALLSFVRDATLEKPRKKHQDSRVCSHQTGRFSPSGLQRTAPELASS